jgi:hypothetical protein
VYEYEKQAIMRINARMCSIGILTESKREIEGAPVVRMGQVPKITL